MHSVPQCSIIMPAFNVEPYIGEAIESVLKQSFSDWDLVVVDDGSTDGTFEVAKQFKDPRIHLVRQKHAGISVARNRGSKEVCSDYSIFLDADDRLRPKAVERLFMRLRKAPKACVAYGDAVVMNEWGCVFGSESSPVFSSRPSGNVLRFILQKGFFLPSAAIVRVNFISKVGGFRNDLRVGEDWEMWCRLATVGEFVYIGKKPITERRLRPDSLTSTYLDPPTQWFRSVEVVFSNPELRKFFKEDELMSFRKKRESAIYAKIGSRFLQRRSWARARHYFLQSLRLRPASPREMILLCASFVRCLPLPLERRLT
jgi:glycosyltransferase involved in cell wall biosynthesis